MVNIERLRRRGLYAYELGRIRAAARIALFLLPPAALCVFLSPNTAQCLCLASALLAAVVALRWRNRRGAESATIGLLAGSVPLSAGIVWSFDPAVCGGPECTAISVAAAISAGLWISLRVRRSSTPTAGYMTACGIAALAASVGCLSLGVIGVLAVVLGIAFGSGMGALVVSPPARPRG
jgi:hypothetical protein